MNASLFLERLWRAREWLVCMAALGGSSGVLIVGLFMDNSELFYVGFLCTLINAFCTCHFWRVWRHRLDEFYSIED